MNESVKKKCIYNLRLAGYLMMNKCPILRVEKNLGRPWRDVYLFEETSQLNDLIEKYKQEKSKEDINYGIINRESRGRN